MRIRQDKIPDCWALHIRIENRGLSKKVAHTNRIIRWEESTPARKQSETARFFRWMFLQTNCRQFSVSVRSRRLPWTPTRFSLLVQNRTKHGKTPRVFSVIGSAVEWAQVAWVAVKETLELRQECGPEKEEEKRLLSHNLFEMNRNRQWKVDGKKDKQVRQKRAEERKKRRKSRVKRCCKEVS